MAGSVSAFMKREEVFQKAMRSRIMSSFIGMTIRPGYSMGLGAMQVYVNLNHANRITCSLDFE